jgi:hypothetical protein
MTWPNFDLDLWPWPISFGMIITNPRHICTHICWRQYSIDEKQKKFEFLCKIKFLRYDITKWRHNVKILLDLERTHQALSYEVQYDTVPSISKFDLGVSDFRHATRPMKVKADRPKKIVSWVADMCYFHTNLKLIQSKYSKNKVFVSIISWPNFDFDFDSYQFGMVVTSPQTLIYANDDDP